MHLQAEVRSVWILNHYIEKALPSAKAYNSFQLLFESANRKWHVFKFVALLVTSDTRKVHTFT